MTEQDAALVDQLRYTHEWGIFQAQEDAMLPSFEECADRIEALSAAVEGLRGALAQIRDRKWNTMTQGCDAACEAARIARAALEATK